MSNSGDTSEKKQWEELKELVTNRLFAYHKPAPEVIRRVVQKLLGEGVGALVGALVDKMQ